MALAPLLAHIRNCRYCTADLPLPPKPILQVGHSSARLLMISHAPGLKVHQTGIPWNDRSGDRLRDWLDLSKEQFYDDKSVANIPMGFCYPGKSKSGDLPPRPQCAPLWHQKLLQFLPHIKLTLLIGSFAQKYYLRDNRKDDLTRTVRAWRDYMDKGFFPLPHPSPRNGAWVIKNPWFEKDVIPDLQKAVKKTLQGEINEAPCGSLTI